MSLGTKEYFVKQISYLSKGVMSISWGTSNTFYVIISLKKIARIKPLYAENLFTF